MRIIIHIDVNNAFLSWTAVEMLNNGSKFDIRKEYAVIGGDEDKRRGIVLAKSNPCKEKGVKTAESLYNARCKCPYLKVYKGSFAVYKKYSDMMYTYLRKYTDIIERYSIDECFLDYTDSIHLFGDPIKIAYKIKDEIKQMFGFTVNVGVGNNKLEAKMASDFKKPDRVHTLFDNEIKSKMWPLPIEDLFMVGKSVSKKLREMKIKTIGDAAKYDKEKLIKKFKSHGKLIWEFANGIDDSEVEYKKKEVKSISSSTVLPYNYNERDKISIVMRELSCEVGKKLRKKNLYAYSVNIWIKYSNFRKISKQMKLNNSIHNDGDIFRCAMMLFDKSWNGDYVRGLCVGVNNVNNKHIYQLSLFDIKSNDKDIFKSNKRKKEEKLQEAIDKIRDKYGDDVIGYVNKR